jgi:hypothetical protein
MKQMPKILCVLLIAGVTAGVFLQNVTLAKARKANLELRDLNQEAQQLARENAEIERLRAESQEIEMLRNETREIHKLRNEVRRLREQKPEWDKLRAENQRLRTRAGPAGRPSSRAPESASLITNELLSDAGLGSPEATLRTFFWAMREGNLEKMRSCFLPGTPDEQMPGEPDTTMTTFKGFRVVAKEAFSSGEVRLGIQFFAEQGAAPVEMVLPFKRVDGEWKVNPALLR